MLAAHHVPGWKRITEYWRPISRRRSDGFADQMIDRTQGTQSIIEERQCAAIGAPNLLVEAIEKLIDASQIEKTLNIFLEQLFRARTVTGLRFDSYQAINRARCSSDACNSSTMRRICGLRDSGCSLVRSSR